MSVIAALRNLQRVDSQVRALSTRLDGAADALAAREREVTAANAKLAEAQSILRQLQASAKNLEAESGSIKTRIDVLRVELNASSKKSQYDAILAEMGTLQDKRDELDGHALEFMTKADAQQARIGEATDHRDERVRRRDAAKAEHDQRRADIADRLAELRREREEAAVQVPAKELALFNSVADEHEGEAMSEVIELSARHREYTCGVCNVELPPRAYAALVSNHETITCCPSCRRILFLDLAAKAE
jgi:predicted  nucleic acid-binding Zn-ribbon protein